MTLDVVRTGAGRLRIGSWRGSGRVGYVAPVPDGVPVDAGTVRQACAVLAARGFERAVTAALGPHEVRGFFDAGFTIREHLHLLSRSAVPIEVQLALPPGATMRRGRRRDRVAMLDLDRRSFPPFWQLDDDGLDEAAAATPSARVRVVSCSPGPDGGPEGDDEALVGYAVFGRAGRRGFVQRVAVDAGTRRSGIGTALVVDGLKWLRRWGTSQTVVNTQIGNDAALALYRSLGFRLEPGGLVVLEVTLP